MSAADMAVEDEPAEKTVSISFEELATSTRNPFSSEGRSRATGEAKPDDMYVRRRWLICSSFVRCSDGAVDTTTEVKFSKSKEGRFRGAFSRVSALMLCGVALLAIYSGFNGAWARCLVYSCFVVPPYAMYGGLAIRHVKKDPKLTVSGSWLEVAILFLLSLQGVAIVVAEWLRPRIDYGMLVMHIGFVQNFSPFREVALHAVTAFGCLLPFVLSVWLRYKDESFGRFGILTSAVVLESPSPCDNKNMTDEAKMLLDMLIPTVILLSQIISTSRRDWSMREDILVSEQLRSHQHLLEVEKKRCEYLLRSMLPRQIIVSALQNEPVAPQLFTEVTVIFIEICDFGRICAQLKPGTVVEVLNIIYYEFDRLSDMLSVYKVETVGEVYMAVVGCPDLIVNHADVAAHFALATQQSMAILRGKLADVTARDDESELTQDTGSSSGSSSGSRKPSGSGSPASASARGMSIPIPPRLPDAVLPEETNGDPDHEASTAEQVPAVRQHTVSRPTEERELETTLGSHAQGAHTTMADAQTDEPKSADAARSVGASVLVRVGLNSGIIRAGVVGLAAPRYKLVGDAVNTASRMESTCVPGRIQVSPSTKERLTEDMFLLEPRGEIQVKGKGAMQTCFLNGYVQDDYEGESPAKTVVIHRGNFRASGVSGVTFGAVHSAHSLQRGRASSSMTGNGNVNGSVDGSPTRGTSSNALQTFMVPFRKSVNGMAQDAEETRPPPPQVKKKQRCHWNSLSRRPLLAPSAQTKPERLASLEEDLPRYLEEMLPIRVYQARVLTLIWMLVVTLTSVLDWIFHVKVGATEPRHVFDTMLVRALCNDMVGILYLLLIAREEVVSRIAQVWTVCMLLIQGGSVLVGQSITFQYEPALVALYGICVLFYAVCTIKQRLAICALAVFGYMVAQLTRCWENHVESVLDIFLNVGFLCVFFVFLACSMQLEEFLAHVSNYDHCFMDTQLDTKEQAKAASSQLLTSLLPEHVAQLVLEGVSPIAEPCQQVTMLFTDIKGFTQYSSNITPQELVDLLNSMYSAFDEIIVSWELYKVEIIGDAYFVMAGSPTADSQPELNEEDRVGPEEYAMRAVEVGLAMLRTLPTLPWGSDGTQLEMRVGLHTGSVVAGVVGKKGPRYHLFGAAVGYASQMESTGQPGRVHISDDTYAFLQKGGYNYDYDETWVEVEGEEEKARTWHVNKSKDKQAQKIQTKLMQQRANKRRQDANAEQLRTSPRSPRTQHRQLSPARTPVGKRLAGLKGHQHEHDQARTARAPPAADGIPSRLCSK